ncbi:MAG: hypothetical protein SF029_11695 [bacterium]|nr:hypothetical protein [bacterium]
MQLIQQWRTATIHLDEILYNPPGTVNNAPLPRTYLQQILTVAEALEAIRPELAAQVRAECEHLGEVVRIWEQVWWPGTAS